MANYRAKLRLLGTIAIDAGSGDRPLRLPRRAVEVLAMLALSRGKPLSRSYIHETLWPDSSDDDGRANLRRHLHLLSKALPFHDDIPWILSDKSFLWWNHASPYAIDLFDFEDLHASGDAKSALERYGGDLLPGSFSGWLEPHRARLRDMALDLLRKHSRIADDIEAIAAAERGLDIYPYDEQLLGELIKRRAASGDRAGALARYRQFERRLRDELDAAPDSQTVALFESILKGSELNAQIGNLPPRPNTSFIGRDADVALVIRSLERARIVTLLGPGGVGKTRLALESVWRSPVLFPGGTWFIDLENIVRGEEIIERIRRAIGDTSPQIDSLLALRERFSGKRALIVLDNCEHVLSNVVRFVEKIFNVEDITILATSRRPLTLPNEIVIPVKPLSISEQPNDDLEPMPDSSAIRLFVDRAIAAGAHLVLNDTTTKIIGDLTAKLDGLPLAIELAASRATFLTLDEIDQRIAQTLDIPRHAHFSSTRHDTLRATVGWSVDLLSPKSKELFGRLSVFYGSFDLAAIEAVCVGDLIEVEDVVALLSDLIEGSLITADRRSEHDVRYRMLKTIRRYSLVVAAETPTLHAWHAQHYTLRATEAAIHRQRRYRMRLDHDNFMAALRWYESIDDIKNISGLTFALAWYWRRHGHVREGTALVQSLLEKYFSRATDGSKGELARSAGILANACGDWSEALKWNQQAAEAFTSCGRHRDAAEARIGLIHSRSSTGQPISETIAQYKREYDELRDLGEDVIAAETLANIGVMSSLSGDHELARKYLVDAVSICRRYNRIDSTTITLQQLSLVYRVSGMADESMTCARESLDLARKANDTPAESTGLRIIAQLQIDLGEISHAHENIREALLKTDITYETLSSVYSVTTAAYVLAAENHFIESARTLGFAMYVQRAWGIKDQPILTKNADLIEKLRAHIGNDLEKQISFGEILSLSSIIAMLGTRN